MKLPSCTDQLEQSPERLGLVPIPHSVAFYSSLAVQCTHLAVIFSLTLTRVLAVVIMRKPFRIP